MNPGPKVVEATRSFVAQMANAGLEPPAWATAAGASVVASAVGGVGGWRRPPGGGSWTGEQGMHYPAWAEGAVPHWHLRLAGPVGLVGWSVGLRAARGALA